MRCNTPLRDWAGQRVWVIGGSSGIGAALVELLGGRGARVAVSARREQQLGGALQLPLDVRDPAALRQAAQQLQQGWGGIDLVVYCAGVYQPQSATSFNLEQALQHDDVNYRGALHALDAVLPLLLAQGGGHISLVSSVAGWRGLPLALAYGPTKAALISLAQSLYLDLHPRGIGVSVVCPGFVQTELTAANTFPMPALQTPQQAAAAILRGWASGQFEIAFPRRFTSALRLLRHLPDAWAFALLRRVTGL